MQGEMSQGREREDSAAKRGEGKAAGGYLFSSMVLCIHCFALFNVMVFAALDKMLPQLALASAGTLSRTQLCPLTTGTKHCCPGATVTSCTAAGPFPSPLSLVPL